MLKFRRWKYHIRASALGFIGIAVLGVMLFGFATALRETGRGWGSSDAAGWMQAIGGYLGVAATVSVVYLQSTVAERQAAKRDAAELTGLLQSLRSELEVIATSSHILVGEEILNTAPNTGVFLYYPVPERPFEVYYGMIPKLGIVHDHALRAQIVSVYAAGASFVATIRYNNDAVKNWEEAQLRHQRTSATADLEAANRAHAAVVNYGDAVRSGYRRAYDDARQLLVRLNDY